MIPGEIIPAKAPDLEVNAGLATLRMEVANTGDRPIQVGSHYHFIEANPYLRFDREKAYGRRLDIPAGTAVRFEPGESKTVELVDIAGRRAIHAGNALADGPVSEEGLRAAMDRVHALGFSHETES